MPFEVANFYEKIFNSGATVDTNIHGEADLSVINKIKLNDYSYYRTSSWDTERGRIYYLIEAGPDICGIVFGGTSAYYNGLGEFIASCGPSDYGAGRVEECDWLEGLPIKQADYQDYDCP